MTHQAALFQVMMAASAWLLEHRDDANYDAVLEALKILTEEQRVTDIRRLGR